MNTFKVKVKKAPNATVGASNNASCSVQPKGKVGMEVSILGAGASIPGPAGPPGDAPITFLAGQNLSAGRVVIIDSGAVWYFQPSDATHAGRAYGVTVTSASIGNDVDVKIMGQVTDAAFSFSTDSTLWVGADGEIFESPQPGILQKAGISSASDTLKIDFSIQIMTI